MKTRVFATFILAVFGLGIISTRVSAANADYVDITSNIEYRPVMGAGYLPPSYDKIYWLVRSGDTNRLYTYDIKSGSINEILKDFTNNNSISNLAWSPDGEKILYVTAGDIYILSTADKLPAQLTRNQNVEGPPPVWVSKSEIAYAGHDGSHSGNSLYVLSVFDQKPHLVFHPDSGLVMVRAFSSQTDTLVYSVAVAGHSTTYAAILKDNSLQNIETLNVPTKIRTEGIFSITDDGKASVLTGALKGSEFVRGHKLYFVSLKSGNWNEIPLDAVWDNDIPYISPDGHSVLDLATRLNERADDYDLKNALDVHLLLYHIDKTPN